MRRLLLSLSAVVLVAGFIAVPRASAQQSINFFVGGFVPRSPDLAGGAISGPGGRGADDVLVRNGDFLTFDFKEFTGPIVGGGWTVALGDMLDAGIDVGFYQRTSPAIYTKFTHPGGGEIDQDLKLRIVPVTATIRFLPLGHHGPARPYIGGGVGILAWRYTETGEFLANDLTTFRDTFTEKHVNTGPVILGGVMIPIGDAGIGGEVRWQSAKGSIPGPPDFSGSKVDLGGMNYLLTISVRF
jgi:hypothetical protein